MIPHIVLVEDNMSDVELIKTAFSESSIPIEISVYRDGERAIVGMQLMADEGRIPNLVLLDLNLPRISGHAVLVAVRKISSFNLVPIIVLSTSNHPIDRNRCLAEGADDYQVKPSRFQDLMVQVKAFEGRWLHHDRSILAAAPKPSGDE